MEVTGTHFPGREVREGMMIHTYIRKRVNARVTWVYTYSDRVAVGKGSYGVEWRRSG